MEVVSSRTHDFELIHGRKTSGTHLTHMWKDKSLDQNSGRTVVFPHDLWSLSSQSPVGPGDGLGIRIGPRLGAIKYLPE